MVLGWPIHELAARLGWNPHNRNVVRASRARTKDAGGTGGVLMPIRPENKARYPKNWKQISRRIRRERASDQCECGGECGSPRCIARSPWMRRCTAVNYQPHPVTGARVILTVAHLDHQPEHCDETNLRAWCQLCHLAYDAEIHRRSRLRSRLAAETHSMRPLFDGGEL